MAFFQARGDPTIHHVEWFELFGRLGVTAVGYPIEYVKVLIQVNKVITFGCIFLCLRIYLIVYHVSLTHVK